MEGGASARISAPGVGAHVARISGPGVVAAMAGILVPIIGAWAWAGAVGRIARAGAWTVVVAVETVGISLHIPAVVFRVALVEIPVMSNAVFDNDDIGLVNFDGGAGGYDNIL